MNDNRDEAIADCKYALLLDNNLGTFTALHAHLNIWAGYRQLDNSADHEYRMTINEIKEKLWSDECLLK